MTSSLLLIAGTVYSQDNRYSVSVKEVKDGDTFVVDIRIEEFDIVLANQTIRALGYDAWETSRHRRTVKLFPSEIEKGKIAKTAVEKYLKNAKTITVYPGIRKRDTYGRMLLFVEVDGKKLEDFMKAGGHIRSNE